MITLTVTIEEARPGILTIEWQGTPENVHDSEKEPAKRIALALSTAIEAEQKIMASGPNGWSKSIDGEGASEAVSNTIEEVKNRLRENNGNN